MSTTDILQNYERWAPRLAELLPPLEIYFRELLGRGGVKIHSLSSRLKSPASLKQKVARPDRSYSQLWEITDLIAFRIVTFSEQKIEDVAREIENSLDLDFSNSSNRLRQTDESKFGYRSLHYIARLPSKLRDVSWPVDFRFEIQIRTSLQHTWAEIEHELGYKASAQLPVAFRRRFSQIASLLEIADRDFDALRRDIVDYETHLQKDSFEGSENLALDEISLKYILERPEVARLDRVVAEQIQRPLGDDLFYPDYLLKALQAAHLKTVRAVLEETRASGDLLPSFVKPYFEFSKKHWNFEEKSVDNVKRGYSLLFIAHMAVLKTDTLVIDKLNRLVHFYEQIDYPNDLSQAQAASHELLNQLKSHAVFI